MDKKEVKRPSLPQKRDTIVDDELYQKRKTQEKLDKMEMKADMAIRDQILITDLRDKIQTRPTHITEDKLDFDPPEILDLTNIKNIEAIKDIEKQHIKNIDDSEHQSSSNEDSLINVEDDMRRFTIEDFHMKAQEYADYVINQQYK